MAWQFRSIVKTILHTIVSDTIIRDNSFEVELDDSRLNQKLPPKRMMPNEKYLKERFVSFVLGTTTTSALRHYTQLPLTDNSSFFAHGFTVRIRRTSCAHGYEA